MNHPRVSVITPTWHRADSLVQRCVPSVQAQTYPNVEHIIVSDGPDHSLRDLMRQHHQNRTWATHEWYHFYLPEHDMRPHWGSPARLHGLDYASGDFIAYCDDDDSLRPRHCELLAAALNNNPEAGFAVSRMECHGLSGAYEVGGGKIARGNVGTPMIMHRREILDQGNWGRPSAFEDWDLVLNWLNEEVLYSQVEEVTCDAWPSACGKVSNI